MSDKNNWLKEQLTRIENKVDNTEKTVSQAVTDIALNKQCYHSLYGAFESHKIEKCRNLVNHDNNDHKGLFGKALGYTVAIFTILCGIIAGVWALATYVLK